MKANAPEKIYIDDPTGEFDDHWSICQNNDSIEYTRTDAFIEKVCGWLKDCATFTDMNGKKRIDKEMYKTTFEDFKNYMRGE